MWIRKLERTTTQDIAGRIVQSYHNKKGQSRQPILRHTGSIRPEAVPALVTLAQLEMTRMLQKRRLSPFPAESQIEKVMTAYNPPQDSGAPGIQDTRKLEEVRRLCLGFHEAMGIL